jgi:carbon-monoxide dehydrogenase small subunit
LKLERQVEVTAEPARVAALLADPTTVARCMPGASVRGLRADGAYDASMAVRVGPVTAEFDGVVRLERAHDGGTGTLVASGSDPRGRSAATAEIHYAVSPRATGGSVVAIDAAIELTGPLAQFERSEFMRIVQERLLAEFGRRLEDELAGQPAPSPAPPAALPLVGAAVVRGLVARLRRLLAPLRPARPQD